ncbi:glycoside hydrolase family 18 protein, partial [Thermothelomyces thermophilus ATCC 42464]
DSTNKFTGSYIRPHTNLTEICEGLSLLWRAGVSPSKVVLGPGWYGCTRSSGTLSNAEIKRVLASGAGKESYDATAGVRWLTWNTDQRVSYDDGVNVQQKIALANNLCLGCIMIWALDQDDAKGSSKKDLLGTGPANGISEEAAESYMKQLANATLQKAVASSCYWTLCGGGCNHGL